ncbi:hypothetical protein BU23DRAFT_590810 [Bimuria novae-zelandiae CBS 107.79]|uniref:catechol O-methyltransferase n=1 Tax=Bimuria novae-zelandiae CBS 107.79 TaxID=1447943 RepID=A0A6A5V2J2_9PLEO|nr:hypothetical protein BU23DRAFT_590810 [Bimuria novae-zelandiae CBS 107.79]
MGSFDQTKAYVPQEDTFFDDGREIELLHFIYSHPNIDNIRGSPKNVLAAINEFGRTKKYLMNVGEDKGRIVCDLIADVKPKTMVELGGYVGYSCILYADAVRAAGGKQYFSLERNPEFAAVISSLVDLSGLDSIVKVVVGSSDESLARLYESGVLTHIDLIFLDHYKPAYTTDLKLCEELGLITPGSVLAADNVIKPGNPPYLEYVRSSIKEKRERLNGVDEGGAKEGDSTQGISEKTVKQYANRYAKEKFSNSPGNPNLVYESRLVNSFEPTGVPNVLLILLSFTTLPFSAALVVACYVYGRLFPLPKPLPLPHGERKTILVTGVSMSKGLAITRVLSEHTPHRLIGADISVFSPGRVSCALEKYLVLTLPDGRDAEPYIDSLLQVIKSESVDLWISCSSVVAAVEDGEVVRLAEQERGEHFEAIQFRGDVVERLHEKDQFIDYIKSLDLPVPESYRCTSSDEVIGILTGKRRKGEEKRRFILKPIGVDDRARANMMTMLPFEKCEDTVEYVKSLRVSSKNPFQVQQYISGAEYCTHALVIRGRVVAFTCCPSSELLMHYEAIPPSSHLFQQMLKFTQRVAEDGGESFSGHLSFDFLAEGEGRTSKLYPIECNPHAHTAVVLYLSTPQLASAYLSAFSPAKSAEMEIVTPRTPTPSYYWIGHGIVVLFILPVLYLLLGLNKASEILDCMTDFWEHVISWRDGTFMVHDPVRFFVLHHVYWPVKFVRSLITGTRWSRTNVCTTKAFEQ